MCCIARQSRPPEWQSRAGRLIHPTQAKNKFLKIHNKMQKKRNMLLKGGHVVDPLNDVDSISDVLIIDGKIKSLSKNIKPAHPGMPFGRARLCH